VNDPLAEFVQVSLLLSLLLREPEPPSHDRLLHVLEAFVDAAVALEASTHRLPERPRKDACKERPAFAPQSRALRSLRPCPRRT
jgi:hypothetical protein